MSETNSAVNASVANTSGISILQITTSSKVELDLRLHYLELNFYESIFSPVVFGDIIISESFNLPSYGPIIGGEDLKIEIWNFIDDKDYENGEGFVLRERYNFCVYSLEKKAHALKQHQVYCIKFCSKEALWNLQTRICTTYLNQKPSEIYNSIFLAFSEEMDSVIQPPQTTQEKLRDVPFSPQKNFFAFDSKNQKELSIHFPNLNPFDCFYLLASRASNNKKGNPYFFFETMNRKFNFICWADILEKYNHSKDTPVPMNLEIDLEKKSNNKRNKLILFNTTNFFLDSKEIFPPLDTFMSAISYSLDKDFDFMENLKKGVYASKLITFDITSKRIKEFTYNYDEHYADIPRIEANKENSLNVFPKEDKMSNDIRQKKTEYKSPDYPDAFIKVVPRASELFLKGKDDFSPEFTKNFRTMKLQELNNNYFTVTIPGNFSVTAGKFFDLYLHSADTNATAEGLSADVHFAGTYFVLKVRHSVKTDNEIFTSVELSKDSFLEKTLQKPPFYKYD